MNASALAYCDEILLLASNEGHIQRLFNCCADYVELWKLSLNPLKSSCYSINPVHYEFFLNGSRIPKSEGFIYLGLPVGTEAFVKTFYSEGPLLPQEHRLHTHGIGFIYMQYCQSIMKFGLKFVYLRKTFLSKLDIRHNIFLKNILGIHHRGGSR